MKSNTLLSKSSDPICGEVIMPGDKSISHRALLLGSIAKGITIIHGFLDSDDCLATLNALRHMGVRISLDSEAVTIYGVGKHGFTKPKHALDCGNSGTTMRLLAGLLVGQGFECRLVGDDSLSKRPMDRIIRPLKQMGADISAIDGFPPLDINGINNLVAINYDIVVASSQVKTCLLFAGMYADGDTIIHEVGNTRDHTERMLTTFSYPILKSGNSLTINARSECSGCEIVIPGDISSAAFFIVAATLIPDSNLLIRNVGINPGRIGILKILNLMGASIEVLNKRVYGEEPVADLLVKSAKLEGIDIPANFVSIAVDEFPIIFIAAAFASGSTLLHGAKELRYKESDRIACMVKGLQVLGIDARELDDGVYIRGGSMSGGVVDSYNDHRIAMAFAIAGLVADGDIEIINGASFATSFPTFVNLANKLNMKINYA